RWSYRLDYVNAKDERPAAQAYEHKVQMVLAEINGTQVGRTLLKCLPAKVPIWILRYDSQKGGPPVTGQMSSDHTKGVHILQYSPELWLANDQGRMYPGYRPDEVLFHEMVHAYRFARFGYNALNHAPLRDNDDHEEFLAEQLMNVYRSDKKAQKFKHNYRTGKLGTKDEVEYTLYSYEPFLLAIEDYMKDPMVEQMAKIQTGFNPFRDLARLKQARAQDLQRGRTDTRPTTRGGLPPPAR
ncbi:MAG TPA: M91 family zinc metallopeptidase, partial [Vineibacter sp.]|nr:M91 family zinc metallopeptidase [Vineibacter sp.]